MGRNSKQAIASALAGAALTSVAIVASSAALMSPSGCNQATLLPAPDAHLELDYQYIEVGDCPMSPSALCAPLAEDAGGCIGEPDMPDSATSAIATDASYPQGCLVNIPEPYQTPQHECLVGFACTCTNPNARAEDAGSQWTCVH